MRVPHLHIFRYSTLFCIFISTGFLQPHAVANMAHIEDENVLDKVKEILSDSSKFKPITVSKEVEPIIDPGTLQLTDFQPVDVKAFK